MILPKSYKIYNITLDFRGVGVTNSAAPPYRVNEEPPFHGAFYSIFLRGI